jgi:hypothetical protein
VAFGNYSENMTAGGGIEGQPRDLYARAQAARRRSRALAAQHRAAQRDAAEVLRRIQAARDRAEQVHKLWLAAHSNPDPLRYSASARLQARLASMPVIEQAKGIIMAQFGWSQDQAFDALRRLSQRENIKVRDLAAMVVAITAQAGSAQSHSRDRRPPSEAAQDRARHAQR